jgi:putative ABC transport system permease protein
MSDETFARLFPAVDADVTLGLVDVGVVRVEEGEDVEKVRAALDEALPDDVTVYTKERFIEEERGYWMRSTPVGFIFQLGLWMGFVVGAVICYQIISTDVSDHLAEYATLKAVGYADRYLNGVVLRETLWLSVLGFLPGWALSAALYELLSRLVGLLMFLNAQRVLSILGLTVAMCVLSGLLALRKVKSADPAEVF